MEGSSWENLNIAHHATIFLITQELREGCNKCALDEEKLYEEVYRFLRKRRKSSSNNRANCRGNWRERIPFTQMGTQRQTTTSNVPKPRLSMR